MEEEQEDPYENSEDFDVEELEEEEPSVEFDSEEIEDYRDLEQKHVKFKNEVLGEIDLTDKHHLTTYIIPDEQRITSQFLTLEELTEAIGIRATQIEKGAPVFTDVTGYDDPIEMARKELLDGKSPLKLIREMKQRETERWVEVWKVNDLAVPITRREIMQPTSKEIQERLGVPVEKEKKKPNPKEVKKETKKAPKKTAPKKVKRTIKKKK